MSSTKISNPFIGVPACRNNTPSSLPSSKVRVVLRVRPFLPVEKEIESVPVIRMTGKNGAEITNPKNGAEALNFNFDGCYSSDVSNYQLFKFQIHPMLSNLLSGINVTIFAYGNTGAGKTFTMEGTPSSPGLIPLVLKDLFENSHSSDVIFKISFLEIYNEKVYDLLTGSGLDLQIREDQNRNIFISNLTSVRITSFEEFASHWESARRHRRSASTKLNPNSSRSHSCLTLNIESGIQGAGWHSPRRRAHRVAKLHLIDLAGSEDNRRTENVGMRMVESGSINKSLFVLSNVVDALNAGSVRIPYRDSKLTRLLQDSLGGRSNALIIANVSPSDKHLIETVHTLNFASKSRQIINNPIVNEMSRENKINLKKPSPLGSCIPISANHDENKENENLHKRIAILEAKLANVSNVNRFGYKGDDANMTKNSYESPIKPVKKKRPKIITDDDKSNLDKSSLNRNNISPLNQDKKITENGDSMITTLWATLQEDMKSGIISDNQIDTYILIIANSGSSSLIKKLPGIGNKRAQIVVEGRMLHGTYISIFDLEKRCDFKAKFIDSMRKALIVQALYQSGSNLNTKKNILG